MKTVICLNEICTQNGLQEFLMGNPNFVICGVCHQLCQLSELYDDPEIPQLGTVVTE